MGLPEFVHRVPYRPWRWTPRASVREPSHAGGVLEEVELLHRTDLRPARRVVGLSNDLLPNGRAADPWENLPPNRMEGAPTNREFFWGRVEDVVEGEIVTTLWSWPSGREMIVALPRDGDLVATNGVRWGDLVAVWTWQELPGSGVVSDRRFALVIRRVLDDSERASLRTLLGESPKEPT